MEHCSSPLRFERGFTLVELMVVVAIIALIAAVIIPNYVHARAQAAVAQTQANLKQIATALELYYGDNQAYPRAGTVGPAMFGGATNPYMTATPVNAVEAGTRIRSRRAVVPAALRRPTRFRIPTRTIRRRSKAFPNGSGTGSPAAPTAARMWITRRKTACTGFRDGARDDGNSSVCFSSSGGSSVRAARAARRASDFRHRRRRRRGRRASPSRCSLSRRPDFARRATQPLSAASHVSDWPPSPAPDARTGYIFDAVTIPAADPRRRTCIGPGRMRRRRPSVGQAPSLFRSVPSSYFREAVSWDSETSRRCSSSGRHLVRPRPLALFAACVSATALHLARAAMRRIRDGARFPSAPSRLRRGRVLVATQKLLLAPDVG